MIIHWLSGNASLYKERPICLLPIRGRCVLSAALVGKTGKYTGVGPVTRYRGGRVENSGVEKKDERK